MKADATAFACNGDLRDACKRIELRTDDPGEAEFLSALYRIVALGGSAAVAQRGGLVVSVEFPGPDLAGPDPLPPPKVAGPSETMMLSGLIDRLNELLCAYHDVPVYAGPASGPTPIRSVVPAHRNDRTGRVSDGSGKTCRRIAVIL